YAGRIGNLGFLLRWLQLFRSTANERQSTRMESVKLPESRNSSSDSGLFASIGGFPLEWLSMFQRALSSIRSVPPRANGMFFFPNSTSFNSFVTVRTG